MAEGTEASLMAMISNVGWAEKIAHPTGLRTQVGIWVRDKLIKNSSFFCWFLLFPCVL